jgi:hypothetical protein
MMVRLAALSALLALALQAPAQSFSHGAPALATSPTGDGRDHGVPAGATSPTPRPFGVNPPLRHVFSQRPPRPRRDHRPEVLVPVPIFYPTYPTYGPGYDYAYPSVADPEVDPSAEAAPASDGSQAPVAPSEDALRYAYLQGARDALAQQQQEPSRLKPSPAKHDAAPAKSADDAKAEAESLPATLFIFKDGRQIETKNFAIMGTTLYDMSGPTLKKVQLTDLDTAATVKANDDRGITVKLP